MNVTIDLAKNHLRDMPENCDVLKADLVKVIRAYEELENRVNNIGWISVKDRLPEEHKHGMSRDVLTIAGSKMKVKSYDYELGRWNGSPHITVTHWRDLEWLDKEQTKNSSIPDIISDILNDLEYEKKYYDDPKSYMDNEDYITCKHKAEAFDEAINIVKKYYRINKKYVFDVITSFEDLKLLNKEEIKINKRVYIKGSNGRGYLVTIVSDDSYRDEHTELSETEAHFYQERGELYEYK